MIISRAPLRISLAGGGTDLPAFYQRHPGEVVSLSINKFVYTTLHPRFEKGIRAAYSIVEEVSDVKQLKHSILREILKYYDYKGNLEITSIADIPSKGSGLGSSSSFTTSVLSCLSALLGKHVTPQYLAELACTIEIERCGNPIGKQDQFAAAFGGVNHFTFCENSVTAKSLEISPIEADEINSHLVLVYTGVTRSANTILNNQQKNLSSDKNFQNTRELLNFVQPTKVALESGDMAEIGRILTQSWEVKKTLAGGISNSEIEDIISYGLAQGALGAKTLGAGGGGFVLFIVPPGIRRKFIGKFHKYKTILPQIDFGGTNVIFRSQERFSHV